MCTKEKINERKPYILVEWSCAHKRNKSMSILIFSRMVVHKRKIKLKRTIYFSRMVVCKLLRLKSWSAREHLTIQLLWAKNQEAEGV